MLVIAGLTLVAGMLAGIASGGRLRNLEQISLAAVPLALASFVCMLIPFRFEMPDAARHSLVILGHSLAAIAIVANARRHQGLLRFAFVVLALGWSLNAAVMVPNGGMPLSMEAFRSAGLTETPTPGEGGDFKLVIADEDTAFAPLGDVIPIQWSGQVVSIGDLLLLAGMGIAIAGGMRVGRPKPVAGTSALQLSTPQQA